MNGAESLIRTLAMGGVDVCFANPGTSEMHFVAALDRIDGVRSILALYEGVATGAADGFWRMTAKPAATLLHLGPGLANGLSNIHNARKASSGVVNIIGEHASWHLQHDAPLASDIAGLARPLSHWVKTAASAKTLAADAAEAIVEARRGRIASLILPGDCAWEEADDAAPTSNAAPAPAPTDAVDGAAKFLRSPGPPHAARGRARDARPRLGPRGPNRGKDWRDARHAVFQRAR